MLFAYGQIVEITVNKEDFCKLWQIQNISSKNV